MKVKLFLRIILILVLLETSSQIGLKRKKIKKIDPITAITLGTAIIAATTKTTMRKMNDTAEKKKLSLRAKYLTKLEGIHRNFLDNMISICSYAMNASALNANLLFSFRIKLESIKSNFNLELEDSNSKPEQIQAIIDRIFSETSKNISEQAKTKAKQKFEHYFSSSVYTNFSKLANKMALIVEEDTKTKNLICFSSKASDSLEKSQSNVYLELNSIAEELEDTSNIFSLFWKGSKTTEYREKWVEKAMKYAPTEGKRVKDLISSNSRLRRFVKGLALMVEYLIPFHISNSNYAIDGLKTLYSSATEENFKEGLNTLKNNLTETLVKYKGTIFTGKFIGSIADAVVPLVETVQQVKSIVDTKKSVDKLENELKSKVIEDKLAADNAFREKSLEVFKMSNNSILCFRMLKSLVNTTLKLQGDSQNFGETEEIKVICRENLYLCSIELGKEYVQKHFYNTKICPKDIFIAENSITSLLEENKFTFNQQIDKKHGLFYWNWFFSKSDSSIFYFKEGENMDVSKEKSKIIKKFSTIKLEGSRNAVSEKKEKLLQKHSQAKPQNHCEIKEEDIEINKFKLPSTTILFFTMKDKLIDDCLLFKGNICREAREILKLTEKKPISNQKDSKKKSNDDTQTAVSRARNDVEMYFLQKICSLVNKSVNSFSDKEKEEMKENLHRVFHSKSESDFKNNSTIYSNSTKDLLTPFSLKNSELALNVLDALFILYKKVIDEKSVVLTQNTDKAVNFAFKMRDFKPKDETPMLTYYSEGPEKCVFTNLIKNERNSRNRNLSPIQILYLKQKGWFSEGKQGFPTETNKLPTPHRGEINTFHESVNEHEIDHLTSMASRIDNTKEPFKALIFGEGGVFNTADLINPKIERISGKYLKFDSAYSTFPDCSSNFQMVKVELEAKNKEKRYIYTYNSTKAEGIFPIIEIKEAKNEKLTYKPYFYLLIYYIKEQIEDTNKNGNLLLIKKKMAKLGFMELSYLLEEKQEMNKTNNLTFVVENQSKTEIKGKLRFEVFVAPAEFDDEKKNDDVCKNL